MLCPSVAVFNTGDSLVAVNISVDPSDSSCDMLSMSCVGGAISPASSEVMPVNDASSSDAAPTVSESADHTDTSGPPLTAAVSTMREEQTSPKDATNTPTAEPRVGPERGTSSAGKENQWSVFPVTVVGNPSSAVGIPGNGDESGASLSAGKENQRRVFPMSAVGNPSNGDETGSSLLAGKENQRWVFPISAVGNLDCVDQSGASTLSKYVNDSNRDDTVDGVSTRSVTSTCSVVKSVRPTNDSLDSTNVLQSSDENTQRPIPWLSAVPSLGLFDSSSAAGLSVGMYRSSASSYSSVRGPIILQNDSQCFTYSLRRYSAAVSHADTEGNSTVLELTMIIVSLIVN